VPKPACRPRRTASHSILVWFSIFPSSRSGDDKCACHRTQSRNARSEFPTSLPLAFQSLESSSRGCRSIESLRTQACGPELSLSVQRQEHSASRLPLVPSERACANRSDEGACRGIKNESHMRSRTRKFASDRSVLQYRQSTTPVAFAVDCDVRHRHRHGMPQPIQKVASTMPVSQSGNTSLRVLTSCAAELSSLHSKCCYARMYRERRSQGDD
jgi:hypothetical protein